MTNADIINYRLFNQRLTETKFTKPQEIVSWLGAVQAQEYAMSKWAIGLRLKDVCDADVEQAFNSGQILRTHLMRPTWHFVSPADIRWLLALTAPRVHAFNAYQYRKEGLDSHTFNKCNDIMVKALEGSKYLTRPALQEILKQNGIVAEGIALSCIMMQAELDGIICSGPRQGKQFTYALLDERVLPTKPFNKEEALAELSLRYFTSRAPATVQDFVWWSGLTNKEAKAGIATLPAEFVHKVFDGQEYIFAPINFTNLSPLRPSFLMPDYDEYGISYKNRSAIMHPNATPPKNDKDTLPYNRVFIIDGIIAGSWKRTIKGSTVEVEITPFYELSDAENAIIQQSISQFKAFTLGATE